MSRGHQPLRGGDSDGNTVGIERRRAARCAIRRGKEISTLHRPLFFKPMASGPADNVSRRHSFGHQHLFPLNFIATTNLTSTSQDRPRRQEQTAHKTRRAQEKHIHTLLIGYIHTCPSCTNELPGIVRQTMAIVRLCSAQACR